MGLRLWQAAALLVLAAMPGEPHKSVAYAVRMLGSVRQTQACYLVPPLSPPCPHLAMTPGAGAMTSLDGTWLQEASPARLRPPVPAAVCKCAPDPILPNPACILCLCGTGAAASAALASSAMAMQVGAAVSGTDSTFIRAGTSSSFRSLQRGGNAFQKECCLQHVADISCGMRKARGAPHGNEKTGSAPCASAGVSCAGT